AAPARFAAAAGRAAHAAAHAFRSVPCAKVACPPWAMWPGPRVLRCAAQGVSPWPVAAAARHDGSRVAALQCEVRPVASVRRYAAPHGGPWLDAAARAPHGMPVRRGAPLDRKSTRLNSSHDQI